MLSQVVAEVLGLDLSRIRFISGDSDIAPKDNGSYSSRVTFQVGNAALDAARQLKAILTAAAARKLETQPENIECLGELYRAGAQDRGSVTWRRSSPKQRRTAARLLSPASIRPFRVAWRQEIPRRSHRRHHGIQLFRAGSRSDRRRGHWPGQRRQGLGRSRLRQGAEPTDRRGPGAGFGVDGHGTGHERGDRLSRRTDLAGNMLDYRVPTIIDSPPISRSASSRATIRTDRSAPRRRAKARLRPSCRRLPTQSQTRQACASMICP